MGIAKFETLIEHLESRMILDDLFRTWFKSFDEELQRCRAEKNRTIVERIKQVIDLEYANPNLCLQFLADTVGLSVSYITKLFKEIEGISLSDHWLEKRMGEAVKLLMETDVLVKEIALSVGFVNENYFFTVFKKQFGITPNEYRRMARLKNSTID
jgi:AraC-like DNA-binding protein